MRKGSVRACACLGVLLASAACGASTVTVSIPDTMAARGDTLWIPVLASGLTDSNVYAYQLIVSFDSTFVTMVGVSNDGTLTGVGSWMDPAWNVVAGEDSLRIACAGTAPLTGEGPLLLMGVAVPATAPVDSGTFLDLAGCILNEGDPAVSVRGGWLFVTPASVGGAVACPVEVERLSPAAIRWRLAGEDAEGGHLEIYDAFGVFVAPPAPVRSDEGVTFTWRGNDSAGEPVSGGVYFYRLSHGDREYRGKVRILK